MKHQASPVAPSRRKELSKSGHQDEHTILPFIFYLDGVHLNGQAQSKLTPAICTSGNFSDELINKDIANWCEIGYLPSLIDLKAQLGEHLSAIYGSKTRLAKERQRFEHFVERVFWKVIVRGINKHRDTGLILHVMVGIGIQEFYPCTAFIVSNDHRQLRSAGIDEGTCIHGCIRCIWSYRDGVYMMKNCIFIGMLPIFAKDAQKLKVNDKERGRRIEFELPEIPECPSVP